ncbi:lysozyme-like [Anticarsia gemmatalis]|uniref:lysozyme-like n=1 Tax=Anticarsia gemmatalis TaxID=129554 RepID=UPI003F760767
MARFVCLFVVLCLASTGYSKKFTKCELVHELRKQGFPENQMKDLVCLVEGESSFQTHVKGGPNTDGSFDWGLFQINDRYWCNAGNTPGKSCNLKCSDLLTDDITAASKCAKTVLASQGLSAWTAWVRDCKGKNLPALNC